jgi:hypothetical protein
LRYFTVALIFFALFVSRQKGQRIHKSVAFEKTGVASAAVSDKIACKGAQLLKRHLQIKYI